MTQAEFTTLMDNVYQELHLLRAAGQKEYGHASDDAFDNFKRTGTRLGLEPEKVLWIFLEKHLDGICSWLKGHKSQRENVRGRINDAIVYLLLLRGMVEENDETSSMG